MNKLLTPKAITLLLLFLALNAFVKANADDVTPRLSNSKSMKVIDFEGDLVEGINKQSLDSLTQMSEEEKRRRRNHLYQKRKSFKAEDQQLINELRIHL